MSETSRSLGWLQVFSTSASRLPAILCYEDPGNSVKLSLSELQKEVENRSLLLSTFYSSGVFIGHYLHGGHLSCKNKQIVAILKHPLTSILQNCYKQTWPFTIFRSLSFGNIRLLWYLEIEKALVPCPSHYQVFSYNMKKSNMISATDINIS